MNGKLDLRNLIKYISNILEFFYIIFQNNNSSSVTWHTFKYILRSTQILMGPYYVIIIIIGCYGLNKYKGIKYLFKDIYALDTIT